MPAPSTEKPCPHCRGTGKVQDSILKTLRAGRDQAVVAKALGMTQSGYSKLEKRGCAYGMRWGMWEKLERYFGVNRNQLLGREPLPAAKPARPRRLADPISLARSAVAKREKSKKQKARRR